MLVYSLSHTRETKPLETVVLQARVSLDWQHLHLLELLGMQVLRPHYSPSGPEMLARAADLHLSKSLGTLTHTQVPAPLTSGVEAVRAWKSLVYIEDTEAKQQSFLNSELLCVTGQTSTSGFLYSPVLGIYGMGGGKDLILSGSRGNGHHGELLMLLTNETGMFSFSGIPSGPPLNLTSSSRPQGGNSRLHYWCCH